MCKIEFRANLWAEKGPLQMHSLLSLFCFLLLLKTSAAVATDFDYDEADRKMIRNGVQAVLTCNGLFTSERTMDQIYAQELAFLGDTKLGDANSGNYRIDATRQWIEVGGGEDGPAVSAVFRQGIGCMVMAPGMTMGDISGLPELAPIQVPANLDATPWPQGDFIQPVTLSPHLSAQKLKAASDWAFDRENSEQDTVALLVVHEGQLIHERYAPGFDRHTRTRTWSTAKSIAATLVGLRVDSGALALDQPLPFGWLPDVAASEDDPRQNITLRQALNMSSGLYPVDSFGMEYATGSGRAYWAGASSVDEMRNRGLIREPGTFFDYENYDTLLAVYALKTTFETEADYLAFPQTALLQRIGMHHTLIGTDRFGDFILSSQAYSNARDLARLGLLHLRNGIWMGETVLSKEWIDFVRSPAPASADRGHDYGGHWWLVPDDRKLEVPEVAFMAAGNRGQYVIVDPSHDLVIVRRGLDYGKQGFDPWSLLAEVLKAFAPDPAKQP